MNFFRGVLIVLLPSLVVWAMIILIVMRYLI